MQLKKLDLCSLLLAIALALPVMITGCAAHVGVGYRVYDPYYSDYHVWDDHEVGFYNQWVVETHRPHREYRRLRPEEQHEYWTWRHGHSDRR